tara:strand:+ start:829 stop:1617 length:789 start_codon:yes stop_codon:yes gene_type:complete
LGYNFSVYQICDDLEAETLALSTVVDSLDEEQWRAPTVAEGWDSHETVLHLGSTDLLCRVAVTDPKTFAAMRESLANGEVSAHGLGGLEIQTMTGRQLWEWFLSGRVEMIEGLRNSDPKDRITWLGPDIGARSLATSRLLETWTHSHDLADTFGCYYPQTDRLRHIAHIGVVTREFSYINHGLSPPTQPMRVELTSPSGGLWVWGSEDAADRVNSTAYEFCKVITRRVPLHESEVETEGDLAAEWMRIAQPWIEPPRISDKA